MPENLSAEQFIKELKAHRSPEEREQLPRCLDRHAATMPRTVLHYAIEHLDEEQRAHYLSLKKATEADQDQGGDRS